MSREWKPGDVAMVTAYNRREEYRAYYDGKTWREYGADMFCVDQPMTLRPLLVIEPSPEMDYQGGQVVAGWLREIARADNRRGVLSAVAHLARQIEAQSTPPEPRGAAAIVEDNMGDWWARLSRGADGAVWHRIGHPETKANWRDITVVRILSEGVTP